MSFLPAIANFFTNQDLSDAEPAPFNKILVGFSLIAATAVAILFNRYLFRDDPLQEAITYPLRKKVSQSSPEPTIPTAIAPAIFAPKDPRPAIDVSLVTNFSNAPSLSSPNSSANEQSPISDPMLASFNLRSSIQPHLTEQQSILSSDLIDRLNKGESLGVTIVRSQKNWEVISQFVLSKVIKLDIAGDDDLKWLIKYQSSLESLLTLSIIGVNEPFEVPSIPSVKFLILTDCLNVTAISPFSNLQNLKIDGCPHITVPDSSNLKILDLSNCDMAIISATSSLESLNIAECLLTTLPSLDNLKSLALRTCPIETIPPLPNLETLDIYQCMSLTTLPILPKLRTLIISVCPHLPIPVIPGLQSLAISVLPPERMIPAIPGLQSLNVRYSEITTIPTIPGLRSLILNFCNSLTKLPPLEQLTEIEINGCSELKKEELPAKIKEIVGLEAWENYRPGGPLSSLSSTLAKDLSLLICQMIERLNKLEPLSRIIFDAGIYWSSACRSILPKIANLAIDHNDHLNDLSDHLPSMTNLTTLLVNRRTDLSKIALIPNLESLEISFSSDITIPPIPQLRSLKIDSCSHVTISELSNLQSLELFNSSGIIICSIANLESLYIFSCPNLNISPILRLQYLQIFDSSGLTIPAIFELKTLDIQHSDDIKTSTLPGLTNLKITDCSAVAIPDSPSLRSLVIHRCNQFKLLPQFEYLEHLDIIGCHQLTIEDIPSTVAKILDDTARVNYQPGDHLFSSLQ